MGTNYEHLTGKTALLSHGSSAKASRGRPVLSPVRRLFVGRAGGSDAKCCSPSCRWKKASLIRWGGCRPQAAAQPRTAHQRRSAVSGMCTAPATVAPQRPAASAGGRGFGVALLLWRRP